MPLVQYYRTVMSFFSFASNGFLQFKKPDDQDDSSSESEEPVGVFEALKEDSVSMDKVANKIFDFCESHLLHDGLQAFPRLFLVHGLTRVAKMLPPPAAEILSRSFDGWKHRTPFDILRMLVEHLEDENLLVIDDDDKPLTTTDIGNVQLAELDHALHQASSLFSKCIERDPLDIQYYGWYLGTLAASLLLSSGNRIGSKAYPFPSEPYTAPTDDKEIDMFGIFSGESRLTEQMVEHPRRTLPKFEEVRQGVQKALKLMVHLYQRQGGSILGNLYISSFLEWDQVIALLAGNNLQETERIQELRSVHYHHAVQWAISEKSTKAVEYLRLLRKSEDLASETKICQYASAIENEPDNVDHWRRLVAVLGPIGFKIPEEDGCVVMDCKDCKMLKEGLNIDHVNLDARKASGEWWGSDRVSWWYSHYLTLPYQYAYPPLKWSVMKKAISVVDNKLRQLNPMPSEHEFSSNTVVPSTSSTIDDIAWLYDESEVDPSEYAAIYLPDNSLPPSFVSVLENDGKAVVVDDMDDLSESGTASEAEIVYLKLIVTCHLFGLSHVSLVQGICKMAQKCVDSACKIKEDCEEWQYFQKLCSMGLDVSKYLSLWNEL
jgi:hypothetical protein